MRNDTMTRANDVGRLGMHTHDPAHVLVVRHARDAFPKRLLRILSLLTYNRVMTTNESERRDLFDRAYAIFVEGCDSYSHVYHVLNEFESEHIDDDEEPFRNALYALPLNDRMLQEFITKEG